MDVQPPSSNAGELVTKFYQLLTRYETFPAAKNFFLVKIERVPAAVTDDNIRKLGFGPTTTRGIDIVKPQFAPLISGNEYMLIATGVDTNTEKTNTESQSEQYKNGLLPTGPYTTGHEYNDTDLDIQFLETNISFIDGIIRPWIQLYSVYGNMLLNDDDPKLTTNIDVFFISKQLPAFEAQINKDMLQTHIDKDWVKLSLRKKASQGSRRRFFTLWEWSPLSGKYINTMIVYLMKLLMLKLMNILEI